MRQKFPIFSVFLVLLVFALIPKTYAFGAGEIPDYAYLAGRAFRHGDLENTLKELNKIVGGHHGINFGSGVGGVLSGLAGALKSAGGGATFSSLDVKRVYLGNFLCDYSQAMDIAGLTKLTADSLLTIVMALSFMTFGFATAEFKVTKERLGCYLCTTHIDNPKGYGEGYNDPREVYPGLRPPVDPEELELNDRNGMKNYIATEGRRYDTSTALLKRVFRACIENGRRARGKDGPELYEAFRLLGQGLHTCEDLLAHSNWCELTLQKLGHREVFCHVGDNVTVRSPRGPVPPLVTGTFGSADFIFSLLGEATDHLSEASLTDLSKKLGSAKNTDQSDSIVSKLSGLLKMIPMGGGNKGDKLQQGENMKAQALDLNNKIDSVAPEEVQKQLWEVLQWHDSIMKDITETIQRVPGLEDILDQITEALTVYVFTILEPFMTPILQSATGTLQTGSSAVIDSNRESQYEVFDDPNASDPSHSLLSKDHFDLILNEPAGLVAIVVVKHVVNNIVQAWYEDSDIDRVIEVVLEVFHHPHYITGRSQVQRDMEDALRRWVKGMSEGDRRVVLQNLTKEAVREGRNKRAGHEDKGHGHGGPASGLGRPAYGPGSGAEPHRGGSRQQQQPYSSGGGGYAQGESGYGGNRYGEGEGRRQQPSYNEQQGYGYQKPSHHEQHGYGYQKPSYSEQQEYGYQKPSYSEQQEYGHQNPPHGERQAYGFQKPSYAEEVNNDYGGRLQNEGYEGGRSHGSRNDESEQYGSRRDAAGRREERREERSYESGGYGVSSARGVDPYESSQSRRGEYGERREEQYGGGYGGYDSGGREEHHKKHGKKHYEEGSSYEYGGQRTEDTGYSSSYGRESRGGYDGGGREEHHKKHGKKHYEEGSSYEYGGQRTEATGYSSSYGRESRGGYSGNEVESNIYGGSGGYGYGGGGRRDEEGGYDRRRDDNEETFGAERLNLNDEEGYQGRRNYQYDSQY